MDRFSGKFDQVGPKPQFNVVFFNKRLHLQTNEKFCQEKKRFINADEKIEGWIWIFFQSKTKYPAKGTYIYNLTLQSESSQEVDSVSGKLVIQ